MPPVLQSMISAAYARDIDVSRAFYELLGFREQSAGRAENSAWCALEQSGHRVLLTSTRPPLEIQQLPLGFYFFFNDLDGAIAALEEGGVEVERLGQPPHAAGAGARVADPDGNTILLGQSEPSSAEPRGTGLTGVALLEEAAALIAESGGLARACQVGGVQGRACAKRAEVRLADASGTTVWACLSHAEEVLIMVPGSFVASEADEGIAGFLARRRG